jgi:hypothetical protein
MIDGILIINLILYVLQFLCVFLAYMSDFYKSKPNKIFYLSFIPFYYLLIFIKHL